MSESINYDAKRAAMHKRYLSAGSADSEQGTELYTNGVDHLALISSDLDATIAFYTGVLKMRLVKIVPNRDEPSSTHIFLDMGGGNLLAFFDFPKHGPDATVRGVGSMHHVALKASSEQYAALVADLGRTGYPHSVHGDSRRGSVYMRDPDGIMVEVTTGY